MKKNMKKKNMKSGQTAVEYILIVAVLVVMVLMFGNKAKTAVQGVTDKLFGGAEKKVEGLLGGG